MNTANFSRTENLTTYAHVVNTIPNNPADNRFYRSYGKRGLDIFLAIFLLPVLVPVIAVLWALTSLDGSSGLFGHRRIGHKGKAFKCWKVRSMVNGAEQKLIKYWPTIQKPPKNGNATESCPMTQELPSLAIFFAKPAWMNFPRSGTC